MCAPREEHSKETKYEGAYVKEPILGAMIGLFHLILTLYITYYYTI